LALHYQTVLGRGQRERLYLTGGRTAAYAQDNEQTGFFSNVATVLCLSGLVGVSQGNPLGFRGTLPWPVTGPKTLEKPRPQRNFG
jgi:hypothetical protein